MANDNCCIDKKFTTILTNGTEYCQTFDITSDKKDIQTDVVVDIEYLAGALALNANSSAINGTIDIVANTWTIPNLYPGVTETVTLCFDVLDSCLLENQNITIDSICAVEVAAPVIGIRCCKIQECVGTDELIDNGDGTFTHTAVDGTVVTVDMRIATVVHNGDGNYTITDDFGASVTFDIDPSVVTDTNSNPNKHEIAQHDDGAGTTVVINESVTQIAQDPITGIISITVEDGTIHHLTINEIDMDVNDVNITGSLVTFTSEDGTQVQFDICAVVAANCNATIDNIQPDGSFDFTDNAGVTITVPSSKSEVTQAFGNTDADVAIDTAHTIATHEAGDGTLVAIAETVTAIQVSLANDTLLVEFYDENSVEHQFPVDLSPYLDDTDTTYTLGENDGTLSLIGSDGSLSQVDLCQAIQDACPFPVVIGINDITVTTAVVNGATVYTVDFEHEASVVADQNPGGNQIAQHDDGQGNIVPINETLTTFTDNGAGTATYVSEDGTQTTIQTGWTTVTQNVAGDSIYTYPDGSVIVIPIGVDVLTTWVNNNDGTITYTDEVGAPTPIDFCDVLGDLDVSCLSDVDTAGFTPGDVLGVNAAGIWVPQAPLQFGEYQGQFDAGSATDFSAQCGPGIVQGDWYNTTNTGTVDGQTFEVGELLIALVDNPSCTTFAGNWSIVEHPGVILASVINTQGGNLIATVQDGNGATFNINETITTLVDNGDGTYTYINEVGVPVTIDIAETPSILVNQNVGGQQIAQHNDGSGNLTPINETLTTFVDNGNGTATYVNEAGVPTTIQVGWTTVAENAAGDTVYTYPDGTNETIPDCCPILTDNGDGSYTWTNGVDVVNIAAGADSALVDLNPLGNQIATHTSGDATVTPINETVTSINQVYIPGEGNVSVATYNDENLAPTNIQIVSGDAGNAAYPGTDGGVYVRECHPIVINEYLASETAVAGVGAVTFIVPADMSGWTITAIQATGDVNAGSVNINGGLSAIGSTVATGDLVTLQLAGTTAGVLHGATITICKL